MRSWRKLILEVIAVIISSIIAIPLYITVINSFKNQAEAADLGLAFPTYWRLIENYKEVFIIAKIPQALGNSSILTFLGVIAIIFCCSTSAYIIQRRDNRFFRIVQKMLIAGMVLPISIITTYYLLDTLHLVRTHIGVTLIYMATCYSFITYLYISFFHGIPREMDEAAIIDGIGHHGLFWKVIFPLLKPINATALIIAFMEIWNDFTVPFYLLNTANRFTLSLTVYFFFGQHASEWNLVFADIVMVSLPIIVFYLFLQRYIVSGLTAGAVKG
ncbi:MAG TPA: carbohydrate ABC transporter permease [Bacilli bacterium]